MPQESTMKMCGVSMRLVKISLTESEIGMAIGDVLI